MADGKKVRVWSKSKQAWLCYNKAFSQNPLLAREFESQAKAIFHLDENSFDWRSGDFEYQPYDVLSELQRPEHWNDHRMHIICQKATSSLFDLQKFMERYGEKDEWRIIYRMRCDLGQIEQRVQLRLDYKDGFNHQQSTEDKCLETKE